MNDDCAVCSQKLKDARLLPCLHSFCRTCIDKLDIATGRRHKENIKCPSCSSVVRLPLNGSSGLPRDITRTARHRAFQCHGCATGEGSAALAEAWCPECKQAFCKHHGFPHIVSRPGHSLIALPNKGSPSARARTTILSSTPSDPLCVEHNLPSTNFCQECGEFVCDRCTEVDGTHGRHATDTTAKGLSAQLKQTVRARLTTERLQTVLLPRVERSLARVENVKVEIARNAETARSKVRAAEKQAVDAIQAIVQRRLSQVDELERSRLEALGKQRDELWTFSEELKAAIVFGQALVQEDVTSGALGELLIAFERRATTLEQVSVRERPVKHPRLDVQDVAEEEVLEVASAAVGNVLPCEASPAHSCFASELKRTVVKGELAKYVVLAKDDNRHALMTGGDFVEAKWKMTPEAVEVLPPIEVTDNDDGSYLVTCVLQQPGDYALEVFINGCKVSRHRPVMINCVDWAFDEKECQRDNTVSSDKCVVTHTGADSTTSSVLGSCGMRHGRHIWKVKVAQGEQRTVVMVSVGVAEKPGLTAQSNNYDLTYSWHGSGYRRLIGRPCEKALAPWETNDTLELDLDCDRHRLCIRNVRSGDTDVMDDLPNAELFAYFSLYNRNDSLSLLSSKGKSDTSKD